MCMAWCCSLQCAVLIHRCAPPDLAKDASLQIGVLKKVECQRKSKGGDKLSMHYTGWTRKDGKVFDSSVKRGSPFDFTLGKGQVIKVRLFAGSLRFRFAGCARHPANTLCG